MAKKQSSETLALDQREAKLGNSISTNREIVGEEKIPRKDIPLTTMINRRELCSLLREPLAADSLFNEKSKAFEPLFGAKLKPIALADKFEECALTFFLGIDLNEVELKSVTLTSIKIDPQVGGMTQLKFTAQYHPMDGDSVADLDHWLDQDVKIALSVGKVKIVDEAEPELPLGEPPITLRQRADNVFDIVEHAPL